MNLQINSSLLAYSTDNLKQLNGKKIEVKVKKKKKNFVITHCDNDNEIVHKHFHCYLEYYNNKRCSIKIKEPL